MSNTSKRVFPRKEVPAFCGSERFIFQFSPLKSPKTPIFGTSNAFPTENKNLNNFSTAEHRTIKLHKYHPLRMSNRSVERKLKFQNPRWPPAPFCIFEIITKIQITYEPFDRFSPNFNPSFHSSLSRHCLAPKVHFPKSKMAAGAS